MLSIEHRNNNKNYKKNHKGQQVGRLQAIVTGDSYLHLDSHWQSLLSILFRYNTSTKCVCVCVCVVAFHDMVLTGNNFPNDYLVVHNHASM
jgi:hypothetical protein